MSNPYSLLLKGYISKSGMSLSEIETEMRKRGFKRNKAYLSSLQNGKMPVPPFTETRELCNVVGGDSLRLGLTGILMEVSDQEFFRSFLDTITTIFATFLDINSERLSKELIEYSINNNLFDQKEETISNLDIQHFFDFETVKHEVSEIINNMPWNRIIINGLKNEDEVTMQVEASIDDFQTSQEEELSPDESAYLKECLSVYRKLNLRPVDDGHLE
ncbi:hypothetical protein ACIQD3_09405 [Peribacillus loiseleuriae]|uniref:hypothetical protein n=1 Tax=Peribacillus loiseleuriae TaxID=1679170 RepID=UPI003801EFBD